jgi:hypothetical protein
MLAHHQEIATRALDAMEADLKLIIENAGPNTNYEYGRQLIYEAAARVPIDESFASRQGSAAFLAEFTARAGGNALRSIGSITETVEDLVARIDLNAEWIPKFARWQATLLVLDGGYDTIPASLENFEYIELVAGQVEELAPLLESLPELVSDERIAVFQALDAYLRRTMSFVDQQRTTLMGEDLRAEREAVLAAPGKERVAVLEAIAEERSIVLEALRAERVATFEDLDKLLDHSFSREVNKIFVRGLVLVVMFLAGLAAIVYLGVRAIKAQKS